MRVHATGSGVLRILVAFAAVPGCHVSTAPGLPSLDGNIVVGDAEAPDFGPDGGPDVVFPRDAQPTPLDAGGPDAGAPPDAGDASTLDSGPPDECTREPVATITASAATAGHYIDEKVRIYGRLVQGSYACAPGPGACQDTCVAPLYIDGLVELTGSDCIFGFVGCQGDGCAQICRPLLSVRAQFFDGILRTRDEAPYLELHGIYSGP